MDKLSTFKPCDFAIVFNAKEWNKTYDLPEGNQVYFQRAKIIKVEKNGYGEWLADVIFDSGLESKGHFQDCMKGCE